MSNLIDRIRAITQTLVSNLYTYDEKVDEDQLIDLEQEEVEQKQEQFTFPKIKVNKQLYDTMYNNSIKTVAVPTTLITSGIVGLVYAATSSSRQKEQPKQENSYVLPQWSV
jgi:hypothetical protein